MSQILLQLPLVLGGELGELHALRALRDSQEGSLNILPTGSRKEKNNNNNKKRAGIVFLVVLVTARHLVC